MLFNPFKRWVLSHNGWYERSEGVIGWQDKLKLFLTRFASVNISVSRVVADHLPVQSIVIHNCYDAAVFFKETGTARNKNVLFVGRLVSDKGAALLLDACIQLWNEGMKFSLTITGDGPEKNMLETKAGTHYPVHFTGAGKNGELRKIYNQNLILVVPSAWKEPFGIVALEGLACGCKVLCSDEGGLPEAVNGFGSTFKRNSITALKEALKKILVAEDLNKDDRELDSFLQKHTPANVARQYIEVLTGGTRMISS
jgi:glycosyltransferase involved in cell wall biosynthesis